MRWEWKSEKERFWAKVRKGPGCWEWQAATTAGYGVFMTRRNGKNRTLRAHRLAYEYTVGPIPDGLRILHMCDNPSCVHPAHLRVGTAADNTADMMAKSRQKLRPLRGEEHGCHKLTTEQVREMRRLHAAGIGTPTLGRMFGMSQTQTYQIVSGRSWRYTMLT